MDSNVSAGSQNIGISVPVPTGVITTQGGPGGNSLLPTSGDDPQRGRGSVDYGGLDFRLIVDTHSGPPVTINLVASTLQEKAAWCSDIGQVRMAALGAHDLRGIGAFEWLHRESPMTCPGLTIPYYL